MEDKAKKLKFAEDLIPLILSGQKTTTWRFFDDKNLRVGDELIFISTVSGEEFAKAKITSTYEKKFKDISDIDLESHEKFEDRQKMFEKYKEHYGDRVNWNSTVKIIKFELENGIQN